LLENDICTIPHRIALETAILRALRKAEPIVVVSPSALLYDPPTIVSDCR
jgi:hypothetical protein